MPRKHDVNPSRIGKRILDLAFSGLALFLLLPILLLIALIIRLKAGSPILFRQIRPGLRGKPFTMYKFRTMSDTRDAQGNLLPDQDRIFLLGRVLRSTSLDEFPELINVLKGDMSLVGPRPLLMQYLSRYNSDQARRSNVQPGITGWAQINGRNALSWEKKLELDVWYVDHWNFWLDVRILLQTIYKILKREGISAEGHATMPEFMGSESDLPKQRGEDL